MNLRNPNHIFEPQTKHHMKLRSINSILAAALVLITVACATKKEEAKVEEENEQKEWKEMDDYHMVMADAFHPYKDSANLVPAKAKAAELAASAQNWANAPLPEKVNNDEMKGKLEQLKVESAAFAQTATTADDKAIGDALTKLHDLFHAIQEDWYGGEEDEHDHEHH
jgi:hypothetical protein